MYRINGDKAQMFADTVQSYGSLMLRCWMWFLGKELGGAVFTRGMCAASIKALATQSCLTLCNPMDWGLPDSSAHGILQARILEWAAIPFSRGSSQPSDWTQVSSIAGRFFTISGIRETPIRTGKSPKFMWLALFRNIRWKDWCRSSNTLVTWCEELTHLKRPWCWNRLKAGGEGDDRGWDGWIASPTQWTWVWVNSRSWSGRPGVRQRVSKSQTWLRDWTELNGRKQRGSKKPLDEVEIEEWKSWRKTQHSKN